MINYIIMALLGGLLLYFVFKYFNLKQDIKEFRFIYKKKSEYGSYSKLKEYSSSDFNAVAKDFQKLIEKNNEIRNERNEILENYRELMANLSHDLRTPLTSILGYMSLIHNEEDIEKIKKYVSVSEKKALYLNDLIEKFYQLSLILNIDGEIEKEYLDLKELLYSIAFEYYDIFIDRGDSLEVVTNDEDIEVFTSSKILSTTIHNIMDNMVKYSLGNNIINLYVENDNIVLLFENKIEIEDGDYSYLFERTKVLDKSRKSSTGIGLSIVDASLEKLNYSRKIYVENNKFYMEIKIPMQFA